MIIKLPKNKTEFLLAHGWKKKNSHWYQPSIISPLYTTNEAAALQMVRELEKK